jgi:thiol-disulfide isomerase/thioredoxin
MKTRIKVFLFLATFVCLSDANTQNTVRLILKDQSILKSDIVKLFVTVDSAGFGTPQLITRNENEFSVNGPNFLVWGNDKKVVPYFVIPGEAISVKSIKGTNLLLYSEGNLTRSNELDFFRKLIERFGNFYFTFPNSKYHLKVNSIDGIDKLTTGINKINSDRLIFLDSCFKKKSISQDFFLIAKNILASSLVNDLQLLFWNNRDLLIRAAKYDLLTKRLLDEVRKIEFLPYFINFIVNRKAISMVTSKYLNFEISDTLSFSKRLEFINKEYTGIAKDFMLTNTLKSALTNSLPISDKQISFYLENCISQNCRRIIENLISNKSKQKNISSNALLFSDTTSLSDLYHLLSTQKNEYIVLDFWASWCAPCRKAMPESEKLRKEFLNRGIQFMYLSLDEDIGNWKLAHSLEKLPDSSSFLLLKSFKSDVVKTYNVSFIPRYMLVTKYGKVINADLPHVGDPRLPALLKKLLPIKN